MFHVFIFFNAREINKTYLTQVKQGVNQEMELLGDEGIKDGEMEKETHPYVHLCAPSILV